MRREPAGRGRAGRTGRAAAAVGRRAALPGALLAAGGAGPHATAGRARAHPARPSTSTGCAPGLDRLFPSATPREDRQRLAAAVAALRAGHGARRRPGHRQDHHRGPDARAAARPARAPPLRVALAAPTGKAAARLQEAVRGGGASTRDRIARDLPRRRCTGCSAGPRRGTRFRHDRDNRLPYDVVVVDETSMVSLTMMARLLEAVRPDARLVLVGDPDQLASVEAGAVLGDLAARRRAGPSRALDGRAGRPLGLPDGVRQRRGHARTTSGGSAARSPRSPARCRPATPTRRSRCCAGGADDVAFVETDVRGGAGRRCAPTSSTPGSRWPRRRGTATSRRRSRRWSGTALLCAHRRGPYGVARWSREIERVAGRARYRSWPSTASGTRAGRVLVTANDYDTGLFNGDTGVVVATRGRRRGWPSRAAVRHAARPDPARGRSQTVHAMTVHRGQGSQFAPGHGGAAARRSRRCSPASCSTPR